MIGKLLNNRSVATRLFILIGLAMGAIAGAALLFAAADQKLTSAFSDNSASVRIKELSYRIEGGVSLLRSHQSTFLLTGESAAAEAYALESAKLVALLKTLGDIPEAAAIRGHVETMNDGITEHAAEFNKIADLEGKGLAARGAELAKKVRNLAGEIEARLADKGLETLAAGALALRRDERAVAGGDSEAAAVLARKRQEFLDPLLLDAPLTEVERTEISALMEAYFVAILDQGNGRKTERETVTRLADILDYLKPGVEALADYRREIAGAVLEVEARRAQAYSLMLVGAAIIFAVFAALSIIVVLGISGPIGGLAYAARDLSEGNRQAFIPVRTATDEIGDITRALHRMRDRLVDADNREQSRATRERSSNLRSEASRRALAEDIEKRIGATAKGMADSAGELRSLAAALEKIAADAGRRAGEVSTASGETKGNLRELAGVAANLHSTVEAMTGKVSDYSASPGAGDVNLDETANPWPTIEQNIGQHLSRISAVALRTRLMALNGIIGAARRGDDDVGLGFEEIADEIKGVSDRFSADAAKFRTTISAAFAPIDEIVAAVDSHGAATREILRNAEGAVAGTLQLSNAVSRINRNAGETEKVATEIRQRADAAQQQSESLLGDIDGILAKIRE